MTQEHKIQTALQMIDGYDWYWRMADDWRYDSAKAGMRRNDNTVAFFDIFLSSIS